MQTCIFGDACDILPYGTLDGSITQYSVKSERVSMADHIASSGRCYTHQGTCGIQKPMSIFCVSGLPCPDMSTAGKRLKRAGTTSNVYLSHGKYHQRQKTPLLLIECTPDHWHNLVETLSYNLILFLCVSSVINNISYVKVNIDFVFNTLMTFDSATTESIYLLVTNNHKTIQHSLDSSSQHSINLRSSTWACWKILIPAMRCTRCSRSLLATGLLALREGGHG